MDYHALGKRIREERLRLNLTQEKLAEEVGVSTAYIGQIERGERSLTLDKLVKVVNRLGVTIDFLLADYVVATDDHSINLLIQLMHDRTAEEKTLAINLRKVLFADKYFLLQKRKGGIPATELRLFFILSRSKPALLPVFPRW